jgi:hypothetical protein
MACAVISNYLSELPKTDQSRHENLNRQAMPTIVVRHKVSDIDAWLKGHAERVSLFAPATVGFKYFSGYD